MLQHTVGQITPLFKTHILHQRICQCPQWRFLPLRWPELVRDFPIEGNIPYVTTNPSTCLPAEKTLIPKTLLASFGAFLAMRTCGVTFQSLAPTVVASLRHVR
jgi:hypothetical protein